MRHGLLAVTRADLADPGPALADARGAAGRHVAGRGCRRSRSARATGAGLDELRAALDGCWRRCRRPTPTAPVRLWVDRAFTIRGSGTVVTGTLGAGTLRVGDELSLDGRAGRRVRGLQSLGAPVAAVVGDGPGRGEPARRRRCAVGRGDALVTPGRVAAHRRARRGGRAAGADLPAELTLHVGSAAVPARVRPLGDAHGAADAGPAAAAARR